VFWRGNAWILPLLGFVLNSSIINHDLWISYAIYLCSRLFITNIMKLTIAVLLETILYKKWFKSWSISVNFNNNNNNNNNFVQLISKEYAYGLMIVDRRMIKF
jgi:hypothetical protein